MGIRTTVVAEYETLRMLVLNKYNMTLLI